MRGGGLLLQGPRPAGRGDPWGVPPLFKGLLGVPSLFRGSQGALPDSSREER